MVFTSGATEAINLAIKGGLQRFDAGSLAVSAIEHAAVVDCAEAMRERYATCLLPVNAQGTVPHDIDLPAGTRLLAVMQVNNEIGTIQPTIEWYRKAKENNALFLCDAVQAYGRIELTGADMIAISAHKFHGPKGVGALWVRDGLSLIPHVEGGGQEQGLRSGTLSPALCAGFGAAAALAVARREEDAAHAEDLW